jgi:hypothetical protein
MADSDDRREPGTATPRPDMKQFLTAQPGAILACDVLAVDPICSAASTC